MFLLGIVILYTPWNFLYIDAWKQMFLNNRPNVKIWLNLPKQPPRGVPRIRRSETIQQIYRSIPKLSSKFTEEHPCRSAISIKLLCNFIQITFRHGCSPVNLLHIFRTRFRKNTSGWLLLNLVFPNSILQVHRFPLNLAFLMNTCWNVY